MQRDDETEQRYWMGVDPGSPGGSCVVSDPPWDYRAERLHYQGQVFKALGVSERLLDPTPEPDPPSAEELVAVLREHPELCASVKRILDEDHEARERVRAVLDWSRPCRRDPLLGYVPIQADVDMGSRWSDTSDMVDAMRYSFLARREQLREKALDLLEQYDLVTEQYDRTVCSGVSPRTGEAMPTTPHERTLCARFASQQWRKLCAEAGGQGISREILEEAKRSKARYTRSRHALAKLGRFRPDRGRVQPPAPKPRRG